MIGLDEAKEIIRSADPNELTDQGYSEIDSAAVLEKDWEHLGEDHYYNMATDHVAGPSGGAPTRRSIDLGAFRRKQEDIDQVYDIAQQWDRQVDVEPHPNRGVDHEERPSTSGDYKEWDRRDPAGKCACDT